MPNPGASMSPKASRAFTLLEMLVATAVLVTMLFVVFSVITQTTSVWKRSANKIEAFQSARAGFDLVTGNLSQATLNTYLDYNNATNPTGYLRKSELKFFIGQNGASGLPGKSDTGQGVYFQAPVNFTQSTNYSGLDSLLNTCGYYISFTTNASLPSHVAGKKNPYRYRLMQLLVPVESNSIYTASGNQWFTAFSSSPMPVADNVIALILRPQDPSADPPDISSSLTYDSTTGATVTNQPVTANQLPPVVQVTMVAIDENSAARYDTGSTPPTVIANALAGKFTTASGYADDLAKLESALLTAGIDCRIFTTAVPIRESKWTK